MTAFQKQLAHEVKMNFYPCNRHLLLESIEEGKKEEKDPWTLPKVLVPEGYVPAVKEFGVYVVVEVSTDCSVCIDPGDVVVVENGMVREINFEGETYIIILENYICGCLSDTEEEDYERGP